MGLEGLASLGHCPITRVVLLGFPNIIRAAIHKLGQEKVTHMLQGVFLGKEVSTRPNRRHSIAITLPPLAVVVFRKK